jgi:hypothetical protein
MNFPVGQFHALPERVLVRKWNLLFKVKGDRDIHNLAEVAKNICAGRTSSEVRLNLRLQRIIERAIMKVAQQGYAFRTIHR